jgi:beta-galactosidase
LGYARSRGCANRELLKPSEIVGPILYTLSAVGHTFSPCCVEPLERRILAAVTGRTDVLIDSSWKFVKGDVAGAATTSFNDSAWTATTLPHTWNNLDGQDGGSNYYRGPAWYRRHLAVDAALAGRRMFLKFDGANQVADLFINGAFVGQHKGGYSAFAFDVTAFLKTGFDNVLAVKMNNAGSSAIAPRFGDFTFFGGIYRDVHFITTPQVHINLLDYASPGVFLKQSKVSAQSANLNIISEIRNDSTLVKSVTITSIIRDAAGVAIKTLTKTISLNPSTTFNLDQGATILSPRLWNGRIDPYLYRVSVKISDSTGTLEQMEQKTGFRFFSVTPAGGFFLNGKPYDLHGVNMHQDRLNKGNAISAADREQDLALLNEIGATMVRLAHYQHSQQTYDRLDEMGIIAWTEIPVINDAGSSQAFTDNATQQLRELIRQNFNHASICFWGIFNELNDNAVNNAIAPKLAAVVAAEDPSRLSTAATDLPDESPLNWYTNVTGFNKYYGWYYGNLSDFAKWADAIRAKYPNRAIGISEYGAGGSIKQHAVPPPRPSANGTTHPEEYQNLFHESQWLAMKTRPFLWSKLVWNLFDFASDSRRDGDTPGRNDKGLITYDRKTKKDAFYWYKANWSASPVLYITSRRFTARTSANTEVKVYSNLSSVTLKINGKSYGAKSSADDIFKWNVTLSAGSNKIEVFASKGSVAYTDSCTWTLG